MSQPTNADPSTPAARSTANPRRTTLASVQDFAQLPGARRPEDIAVYGTDLPANTANPRRTILMVAPVAAAPQD